MSDCARVYMLSAVSQRARLGPVYLVFITKPFLLRLQSGLNPYQHTQTTGHSQWECVYVCACVRVYVHVYVVGGGVQGIICTCMLCVSLCVIWPYKLKNKCLYVSVSLWASVCVYVYVCVSAHEFVCVTSCDIEKKRVVDKDMSWDNKGFKERTERQKWMNEIYFHADFTYMFCLSVLLAAPTPGILAAVLFIVF